MIRNCNECKSPYKAEQRYLNRGQGLFCSRSCSSFYHSRLRRVKPEPNANCSHCGKAIYRKPSHLTKTDTFFCDKDCQVAAQRSGTFRTGVQPTGLTLKMCQKCNRPLSYKSRKTTTMHRECKAQHTVEQWLSGNNDVTLYIDDKTNMPKDTKPFVKKYLLETRGDRCEECGFDKHGPFGSIIQMDHVNGDCFDNRPENLKLLCPNCHAMTPTYGSRNRGSGRAHRRKQ